MIEQILNSAVTEAVKALYQLEATPAQIQLQNTRKEFEGDLKYIKERGFTPILTQQLIDYAKQGKSLPKKPLMITSGFSGFLIGEGYSGIF